MSEHNIYNEESEWDYASIAQTLLSMDKTRKELSEALSSLEAEDGNLDTDEKILKAVATIKDDCTGIQRALVQKNDYPFHKPRETVYYLVCIRDLLKEVLKTSSELSRSLYRVNNSDFEQVAHLFDKKRIPVRDPFPMRIANNRACIWVIDNERLDEQQYDALILAISRAANQTEEETRELVAEVGCIGIRNDSVESVFVGPVGFCRVVEFMLFTGENSPNDSDASEKMKGFLQSQIERWVDGEQKPDIRAAWESLPEHLITDEIQKYYAELLINERLQKGGYSVFDVLTGRAMVDVLNEIDPEFKYSLVDDNDDNDDSDPEIPW